MTVPELEAIQREDLPEGWKVFCDYCERFHFHGKGLGHRIAHCCSEKSPYYKTGYILVRK